VTTLTGKQVHIAAWLALRACICLHISVPAFNRRGVLAACKNRGFKGRTLAQARVWVDEQCDALSIARNAGIPAKHVRENTNVD
jgi:hypothetical protein